MAYSLKIAKKNTAEKHLGISDVDKSTLSNSGNGIIINDLIEYVNTYIEINDNKKQFCPLCGYRKSLYGYRRFLALIAGLE